MSIKKATATGFTDPNWTQVPNVLLGHIVKKHEGRYIPGHMAQMGYAELKVVLILIRYTYGFGNEKRTHARVSLTTLQKATGMGREAILNGAKQAVERGLIRTHQDGGVTLWEVIRSPYQVEEGGSVIEPAGSVIEPAKGESGSVIEPPSKKERKKERKEKKPASGGVAAEDSSDNGRPLYQVVDVADLVDAAPDVPHTELTASCENCGAIMERDADCPDCGTPTFWKLGRLTGRQRDAIKKLEKPNLLVAPGDELGRRAARLWSDGVYWRSASQRATFLKLKKIKERGWFLQILSWAEKTRGITFASFRKALNNPVQYQKWEDRQQNRPDAEGYAENRQAQDDAALAEAQAQASQVEPVDLEAMGIVTR